MGFIHWTAHWESTMRLVRLRITQEGPCEGEPAEFILSEGDAQRLAQSLLKLLGLTPFAEHLAELAPTPETDSATENPGSGWVSPAMMRAGLDAIGPLGGVTSARSRVAAVWQAMAAVRRVEMLDDEVAALARRDGTLAEPTPVAAPAAPHLAEKLDIPAGGLGVNLADHLQENARVARSIEDGASRFPSAGYQPEPGGPSSLAQPPSGGSSAVRGRADVKEWILVMPGLGFLRRDFQGPTADMDFAGLYSRSEFLELEDRYPKLEAIHVSQRGLKDWKSTPGAVAPPPRDASAMRNSSPRVINLSPVDAATFREAWEAASKKERCIGMTVHLEGHSSGFDDLEQWRAARVAERDAAARSVAREVAPEHASEQFPWQAPSL